VQNTSKLKQIDNNSQNMSTVKRAKVQHTVKDGAVKNTIKQINKKDKKIKSRP